MKVTSKLRLLNQFKKEICLKYEEHYDLEDLDWTALSVGFFLAKGATVEQALDLAGIARYEKQYWMD